MAGSESWKWPKVFGFGPLVRWKWPNVLKVFSTAEYAEYAEAGLQKLAKDTEVDGEAASSDQPDI